MFSFKVLVDIWPFLQPTVVAVILVNHNFSLFSVFFQSTCGEMAISATYCCCSYTCKSLFLLPLMFSFKVLVEVWPFQQPTPVTVIFVNHNFSFFNVFFQSTCGGMAISATYCCYSYTCKSLFLSLQYFLSKYLWRYGHFSNLLLLQLYLLIIISLPSMFSFKVLVEVWPFQQPTPVTVILVNHNFSFFNVFFQSTCGGMAISATCSCYSYTC